MLKLLVACVLILTTLDHCQAGDEPSPVSPRDINARRAARFALDQFNAQGKEAFASKLLYVDSAKVGPGGQLFYVSFVMAPTRCRKPRTSLDFCSVDTRYPRKNCHDVTVMVHDSANYKMEVMSFANCQPSLVAVPR
ncbi:hypothetical protein HDE_13129 [Halotydeus destructor]|nr:hypothetical protein HDE_13129 [Halotydeus destructor]